MQKTSRIPARLRGHWWWAAPLAALLVIVGGGNLVLQVIPLRSIIEEALTKELGEPFHIGSLRAYAFTGAHVTAYDVQFGEGDFMATADRVVASGSLWQLARQVIDIESLRVEGLEAHGPDTAPELIDRWNSMIAHVDEKPEPDDGGFSVRIRHAASAEAALFLGAARAVTGDITLRDVTEPQWDIGLDVVLTYWPENPVFRGAAQVSRQEAAEDHWTIRAGLEGFHANNLGFSPRLPAFAVDLDVAAEGALPDNLAMGVHGTLTVAQAPGLSGDFTGDAWLRNGQILVNDVDFSGPGLTLEGDYTRERDGRFGCQVHQASAQGPGLTGLFKLLAAPDAGIEAQGDGTLDVTDFLLGDAGEGMRFVKGRAALSGIDYVLPTGEVSFDNLGGNVHVSEGVLRIDDISGSGFSVRGDIHPDFPAGTISVALAGDVALNPARLAPWAPAGVLQRLEGTLAVERLAGTFAMGADDTSEIGELQMAAQMQDVCATITPVGIAAPLVFDHVAGHVQYENGTFTVSELGGERFAANGSVRFLEDAYTVDVSGHTQLDAGFVRILVPGALRELGGRVTFDRIAGTFGGDTFLPPDLVVDGQIEKGRAAIKAGGLDEQIEDVSARFSTSDTEVKADIDRIVFQRLGTLRGDAAYTYASRRLDATLHTDLGPWAALAGGNAETLRPILAAYGPSTLAIETRLPEPENPAWSLGIRREGDPSLTVAMQFGGDGPTPDVIEADTTLPATAFREVLPNSFMPEGNIPLHIEKPAGTNTFTLNAELDNMALRIGKYLHKPMGGAMGLELTGSVTPSAQLTHAVLTLYGESVQAALDGGIHAEDLALDLAPLTPLLPEGGAASGRVTGTFDTATPMADLTLHGAGWRITPEASLDTVDGALRYNGSVLTFDDVRVRGSYTDCTIQGSRTANAWEAAVTGSKLDLDALLMTWDAVQSAWATPDDAAPGAAIVRADNDNGMMRVRLDEMQYNRARMTDVQAEVTVNPDSIRFDPISLVPYTGRITGSARVSRAAPMRLDAKLIFDKADVRILDEAFLTEPQGLRGLCTGTINAAFPLGDMEAVMGQISGDIDLRLKNGSYGDVGVGGRALSFLRVLEIIHLRLPKLENKGLAYDTSTLVMKAVDGRVNLDTLTMNTGSYEIKGGGVVDYAGDDMELQFRVHLLEVVTGLVSKVPVLGNAVDALSSVTDLVVTARGKPDQPDIMITPGVGPRKRE